MTEFLVLAASYLFGSIPWALVIGLVFFHKDIRKEGSGNLGGTNAGRVLGRPAGVTVILLDALKAFFSMLLAHFCAPGTEIYAGLACCIGHCFPIFAHFKGGKAVATSYGFLLGITVFITHQWFWNFFWVILCFFLILYLFRMVSLASICALGIEVITSFILYFSGRNPLSTSLALLILWAFITYRHKANIGRIAAHTESHVKWMGRELWGK
ncbi:MAG: glycerol-3-phosphate 1-O-acyltransferase PlsY [Solobacterium sp.]|jgi:glycerol-3-phosphate acyltransferase PlsY|nr:glycerol-3-phosphate 1-O-acyltransferase PlsY [Solobacterium sp.]MCH4205916.1 glycerol-3-phosphate 1-O-acyltransferase PlsY [Solobacterium sp.]MCH4226251.1 glycerol-3-phosphate 1-O-acyltransferase PlsY [Solobacterium sp.]MCH4282704.1 glycerol-3-phosphate 1-O-acyltransferase PlsY [Solobacterium sp.]